MILTLILIFLWLFGKMLEVILNILCQAFCPIIDFATNIKPSPLLCPWIDFLKMYKALSDRRWKEAIYEEMKTLYKNETCDIVDLSKEKNSVGCKWVFTI